MTRPLTSMPPVVSPGHLHDVVVDAIGSRIVDGRVPAGSVLATDELERGFAVSRSVVREAVRVLAHLRLVEVRRRVGITVLPAPSWNPYDASVIRWRMAGPGRSRQVRELHEWCAAVMPAAARLAAQRADPRMWGELEVAAVGLAEHARNRDAAGYTRSEVAFHHALLSASGNPFMAGSADAISILLSATTDTGRHQQDHVAAVASYSALACAVRAGDVPGSADAAAEMWRQRSPWP